MRTLTLPNETLLPEVVKLLLEEQTIALKAKGNSMLPFIIGDKDSVLLQKREIVSIGNIVLAEIAPKLFVLHRIIKIKNDKITLMGDGNLWEPEECTKENISGQVIAIIRNGKAIDCNSKKEQRKVMIWKTLLPIRKYLLAIYRRIK